MFTFRHSNTAKTPCHGNGPIPASRGLARCPNVASLNRCAGNDRFDVLTTPVADLQALLDSGRLTSVELVDEYLAQITRHNTKGMVVRALISIAPRVSLLEQASDLDAERRLQGKRGPMHGIPVIVKVQYTFEVRNEYASLIWTGHILDSSVPANVHDMRDCCTARYIPSKERCRCGYGKSMFLIALKQGLTLSSSSRPV
jgi:hypothetical protein